MGDSHLNQTTSDPDPLEKESVGFGFFEKSILQLPPLFCWFIAGVLVPLGFYFIWRMFRAPELGWALLELVGALACLAVGLIFLWSAIRHPLVAMKLGNVDVKIEPRRLRPGETVTFTIRFQMRGDVGLEAAVMRLTSKQYVRTGDSWGWDAEPELASTVWADEINLVSGPPIRSWVVMELQTTMQIPPNALPSCHVRPEHPSVETPSIRRQWTATIHLKLAGWLDWERDYLLLVSPRIQHDPKPGF